MTRKHYTLLAVGIALGLVLVGGFASAQLTETTVTADQPDNQTVEADLTFSGTGTTATAELSRDGTVVASENVTGSGTDNLTAAVDMTGLQADDYNLSISATDESNVSVDTTRMRTHQTDALNVTENETVQVDVGFVAEQQTNATVEISQGSQTLNTTTLQFDPVDADDGAGVETLTWESTTSGYLNVTVETTPASGYNSVTVQSGDSLVDTAAGYLAVDAPQIPPWAQAAGGLSIVVIVGLFLVRLN